MTQVDVTFLVPGNPVAKGRPRARIYNGHVHLYTPAKTKYYEQKISRAAGRVSLPQLEGPIRVDILSVTKRPKRLCRKKDPQEKMYRPAKPDGDNVRKAVLDGLSLYFDDKQVVSGETVCLYAVKDAEDGYTLVRIQTKLETEKSIICRLGLEKKTEDR